MKHRFLVICMISLIANACAPLGSFTSKEALNQVNSGSRLDSGKAPSCTVDYADYELEVKVLAFEILDKKGFSFGFDILNNFFQALGLSVESERGQMTMSLGLRSTIKPDTEISHVVGRGQSKRNELKFKLDAVKLGTEFGYFKQTPLSQLTERTLGDSISRLNTDLDARSSGWKTKVVYVGEDEFVIPVGSASGVRMGDTFDIFNTEYIWEGQPCVSALLIDKKTTTTPIVKASVSQVGDQAALLKVIERLHPEAVRLGARVEVSAFAGNPRRLARPVRIRKIESGSLELPQGLKFDFKTYVHEQIRALLPLNGFQVKD